MKLQKFNINNPSVWTDVIPETDNVLNVSTGGGYIFAKYMKDAVSFVKQFDYNGKLIREITLPEKELLAVLEAKKKTKNFIILLPTTLHLEYL